MAGRLQEIFENAVDLKGGEREAYLRGACGRDAALRTEVDALLRAHERAAGFMSSPTAEQPAPSATPTVVDAVPGAGVMGEGPGSQIGAYKLLQLIGEGGFGSVFMAEQEQPVRRKVAFKIIKLGMDTKQVVARFEQERQALAILDHANIAKVFDAGATETGRPYFVMELVKGDPIVEYCDRNNLSIKERLDLFSQVCGAVQHAHTKGIIHRDIKPSNILVSTQDGRPHVKVIDFGIAKATASKLTEKTLFTEHRQLIGTPEYMSPEQAEGSLDIDTRTDVYSLGVVLYELLTGTTPFTSQQLRSAAYAEIQRIIREVEPPKPSTRLSENTATMASVAVQRRSEPRKLGVLVRGELDWIVMKALEKDRQRRYESPSSLGADIQRHLNREPVSAGPPSASYKFRKFVQRNRVKVAAAGLVMAVLVLGVIGTSSGLVWAVREKSRADDEAARARQAAAAETKAKEEAQRRLKQTEKATDILASVFESLNPREIAMSDRPLQSVLAENLDNAVKELQVDAVGDSQALLNVQHKLGHSLLALGEAEKAIALYQNAERTSAQVLGPEDPTTLGFTGSLAMAYGNAGKYDIAIPMLERLIAHYSSLNEDPGDLLAINQNNLGLFYRELGQFDKALPLFEKAVASRRVNLGPRHAYTLATINALATTLGDLNRLDESFPLLQEAVEGFKETLGTGHPSTLAAMNNLGTAYQGRGDHAQAIALLEEVVRTCRERFGSSSPNTLASLNNLGSSYGAAGMNDKAVVVIEEALMLMRTRHGNDYPNTMNTMSNLAATYWRMGKLDKSVPLFEELLTLRERNFGRKHIETLRTVANLGINYRDAGKIAEAVPLLKEAHEASAEHPRLGFVTFALADAYARLGKREEALAVARAATDAIRGARQEDSPWLAGEYAKYGSIVLSTGDGAAAEPMIRECLAIRERIAPDDWTTFSAKSMLGGALILQENYAEAERLLLEGYRGLKEREGTMPEGAHVRVTDALDRLVALYEATGNESEAAKWRAERGKQAPSSDAEKR